MLRTLAGLALLCAAPACYSGIDPDGDGIADGDDFGEDAGEGADEGSAGEGDGGEDGEQAELPSPSPRFYRLTHEQWENTVQDLFELDAPTGHSSLFRADPQVAGFIFDNDVSALEIDEALWNGYRIAAGEVADLVTADPELLATFTPEDDGSELSERADAFVRSFGARAYRRPLEAQEVTTLTALFEAAPPLYPDMDDDFAAGVRHVVETVLQSPFFLYRIERSATVVDGLIPLDDYEIASRLSYFLWNSMPDAALLEAAAAGSLTTTGQVAAEAERMLEDPRAGEMVVRFHYQLFEGHKFETIAPSANFFPDAPEDLPELVAEEHERFVRDVVFGGGGGLVELLTSSETFVNDDLAALYGVEGVMGDEFTHVDLDPSQRQGVFTQTGFLAANSTSVDPDPIHRGVFLAKRMSCLTIAAPPDGVPPLPAIEPDQTNRERVEAHTEAEGTVCVTCHSTLINPFGFAFEGYDALGTWRTVDNGKPVDASSTVFLGTEPAAVDGAIDLMQAMASSEAVHQCYAKHWFEYASGRNEASGDDQMIERLGAASLDEQQSIAELLVNMTTSPAFLNRAAEEL
ncbi:DUF1592 domain-containing protein [Pseudenhygromyxa sp. WMMC2535]|nr:DUF1592 domain-containing protein [Pseudenhygromyxa sp. WMMC2535]NVB36311.1 DUF1592 domain-containing protein [Pseudenhygromyxa sp. WMMC2535]